MLDSDAQPGISVSKLMPFCPRAKLIFPAAVATFPGLVSSRLRRDILWQISGTTSDPPQPDKGGQFFKEDSDGYCDKERPGTVAHLMRRAGFGATRSQIEALEAKGYDAVVDDLLDAPEDAPWLGDYMVRRFHHEQSGMMGPRASGENWLYAWSLLKPSCRKRCAVLA